MCLSKKKYPLYNECSSTKQLMEFKNKNKTLRVRNFIPNKIYFKNPDE